MSYLKRLHLARALEEARDNARADAIIAIGPRASSYAGRTPPTIEGRVTIASNGIGWGTRSRVSIGRTIRAGKKGQLKLVPPRFDAGAPKHGGATLAAGEWLDHMTGEPRVASTSVATTRNGVLFGSGPVTVLRGDDDAALPIDTDPGTPAETAATEDYFRNLRIARGDIRPEDYDSDGNLI